MKFAIVSGYGYWGRFDPEALYHDRSKQSPQADIQIGGGETAMLQIARQLALKSHDVTLFYDINRPRNIDGVNFLPASYAVGMLTAYKYDVLVSWDVPAVFRFADTAEIRVLAFQLNETQVGAYDHVIDLYLHPSRWHMNRYKELYPEITSTKQLPCMTNGIDFTRYLEPPKRDPHRVVYSSSPDRGLHHLLRMWPKIVKQVPDASLHIYYDINTWLENDMQLQRNGMRLLTSDRADFIRVQLSRPHPNITLHGGIGQWTLAREQMKGSVMCYPCDPVRPTEGYSMSVLEGITAGMRVITTDADALGELWFGQPNTTILPCRFESEEDDNTWVEAVVKGLTEPRDIDSPRVNPTFSWSHIADRWIKEIVLCLRQKR